MHELCVARQKRADKIQRRSSVMFDVELIAEMIKCTPNLIERNAVPATRNGRQNNERVLENGTEKTEPKTNEKNKCGVFWKFSLPPPAATATFHYTFTSQCLSVLFHPFTGDTLYVSQELLAVIKSIIINMHKYKVEFMGPESHSDAARSTGEGMSARTCVCVREKKTRKRFKLLGFMSGTMEISNIWRPCAVQLMAKVFPLDFGVTVGLPREPMG